MKIFIKKEVKERFKEQMEKLIEEISKDAEFFNIVSEISLSLEAADGK